jgi:hypothetical protein
LKDLPGLAWILGLFVPAALLLIVVARMGPKPLPPVANVWTEVDQVRQGLAARSLKLNLGETHEELKPPFVLQTQRVADSILNGEKTQQYIVRLKLKKKIADLELWAPGGFEVGMVDLNPAGAVGDIRLASVRKLEEKAVE